MALSDLVVVEVTLVISVLVNDHEKAHYLSSEVLALDDVLCDTESVTKIFLDGITRFFHSFLYFVQSSRLQSDTDSLLEFFVLEASLEHLIDDDLHFGVNLDWLSVLFFAFVVHLLLLELDVLFNALVDESLDILSFFVQVELLMCIESQSE